MGGVQPCGGQSVSTRTEFPDVLAPAVEMPFRWNGSYQAMPKLHVQSGPRGVAKQRKLFRRLEAAVRNSVTPHDRTRAHRLGRCNKQACVLTGEWDGSLIPPYDA